MLDAFDFYRRDRRAFYRRQQCASQGIAYGGPETAFERLSRKASVAIRQSLAVGRQAARHLKTCPEIILIHNVPSENRGEVVQPSARVAFACLRARPYYLL